AFIENQTLRASVGPVEDVYGNVSYPEEPFTWEFFVNRNPIGWTGGNISNIVIFEDETFSTTRQLVNSGGSDRAFQITNIPPWLTVSPREGILTAGAAETITFELREQLGVGIYNQTVYASGTLGDEPMIVDIRVLCYPPNWWVDPTDYRYTMSITATLSTGGQLSDDPFDMVGVFVGDELRGVANVVFVPELAELPNTHPYEVFLTVFSNRTSGEKLSMRVWDATECTQLGRIEEDYEFVANTVHGTPTSPVTITATSQIIQNIPFPQGWTWFSLNLEDNDMSVNALLDKLSPADGDLLKSQTTFDQYVTSFGWVGTLDTLRNESMYQIRISNLDTLELVGYAVDVEKDTIPVVSGWNWIGYLPQTGMNVNDALASLEGAATGDLIKNQVAFAQFVENLGWIGSLKFMNPKQGYQIKLLNPGELLYPFVVPGTAVPALAREVPPSLASLARGAPDWFVNPADYEHNMTMVGVINKDGVESVDSTDVLGAFVGEEVRGIAQPTYVEALDRYLVFLMIYSNETDDEKVEFRLFDAREETISDISETVAFAPDTIIGSVQEPFVWTKGVLGIGDPGYVPDVFSLGQNYPNPFNPVTTIGYGLPEDAHVQIVVFDLLGRQVRKLVMGSKTAGYHFVHWDGRDGNGTPVPSGVYLYRMTAGSFVEVRKLVVLR
ncbi:MAG: FlgD immunoglobulin-like domain containing protein, partial [Fidelibacterota bacterium]